MSLTSYRTAPPREDQRAWPRAAPRGAERRPERTAALASWCEASREDQSTEIRERRSKRPGRAGSRPLAPAPPAQDGRGGRSERLGSLSVPRPAAKSRGPESCPDGRTQKGLDAAARAALLAWRRPALPPFKGQYPGRGAVSRPSSEWGRVGPARCDHQAKTTARAACGRAEIRDQRSEISGLDPRGQTTPANRGVTACAPAPSGQTSPDRVVKLGSMGCRDQLSEVRCQRPRPCRRRFLADL